MSGMQPKTAGISPETIARECQAIARRFAEHYGRQRGLHILGKAIGEGDRRARALLDGEARRIEAHEYLLAREAGIALRREERAQIMARLRQIETEIGSTDAEARMGDREGAGLAHGVA